MSLKKITRNSEVINFTEVNINVVEDSFDLYDLWKVGHIQPNLNNAITVGGTADGRINDDDRHGKFINASYYDGHFETKVRKQLTLNDFVVPH